MFFYIPDMNSSDFQKVYQILSLVTLLLSTIQWFPNKYKVQNSHSGYKVLHLLITVCFPSIGLYYLLTQAVHSSKSNLLSVLEIK